ncbi:unnamed protein product [Paramecium sonneborni]|uniref:Peptidase S54 rhomboid domain-containing protein n=1 Tax=Paramecium sonneborni TaxID=65129 RepID=A0A8S1KNQ6_9CILI|nr:unnamed protein product [Paramecium sonneborni]
MSQKFEQIARLTRNSTNFKANFVPLTLVGTSLISFIAWSKLPYGQAFPHLTISEYVPKKSYFHSLILAPLNFQTNGHLSVYGPAMLYSFYQMSSILCNTQFLAFYLINSVICSSFTVYYEKKKSAEYGINLMSPKCVAAITPLSFMTALLVLKPHLRLVNKPPLPFFLVTAMYCMYEIQEYQNGFVNEVCRPTHILAMINGLILGLIFKRFI